jgi:2-dehydro-3-deoxygluconokinase
MNSKVVTFGEIMLRLATPGFERFSQVKQFNATFGGGEANVAVSLANYGLKADFVTRLPKNDLAQSCLMDLRKYNVGVDNIIYGGDRLGIYFLETAKESRFLPTLTSGRISGSGERQHQKSCLIW